MSSIDFSTLTQKIAALLAAHPEQPVLIALDGRCGSGKTTLAGQLAEQFPASIVFHTDAGEPVFYRAYSCREGAYRPGQCIPAQPLSIVEGSYSHHPLLAGCYDLKVFVTCSPAEQTRRLQAREGERYPSFAARWIPLEEGYIKEYGIEEKADLVLDTTGHC